MITPLYRKVFELILKKQLRRNFACFCAGQAMTDAQASKLISQNEAFYTAKMKEELASGMALIKRRLPWLDLASWSFVLSLVVCASCMLLMTYSELAMPFMLASAALCFGVVTTLLLFGIKIHEVTIDEGTIRRPASAISVQMPLFLIQAMLGASLCVVGALTHSFSSVISGSAVLTMSAVTQYAAMSNFLMLFESRDLTYEETREFLQATPGLYSRDSKAWLLEESMEGASLKIGTLQRLQSFKDSSDADAE